MIWNAFLFMGQAWAAGGEHAADHAGAHAVPWGTIFVQAFNLGFLLIILTVLLRKTVKAHFESRAQSYRQLVSRAETAREEAERGRREVKEKLARLEADSSQVVQQARSEAEELRGRMLSEAKDIAQRLQQEAERTVKIEVEKAKAELRAELMTKAIAAARDSLKKNMTGSEQQKLQREFAEKIQVVGG